MRKVHTERERDGEREIPLARLCVNVYVDECRLTSISSRTKQHDRNDARKVLNSKTSQCNNNDEDDDTSLAAHPSPTPTILRQRTYSSLHVHVTEGSLPPFQIGHTSLKGSTDPHIPVFDIFVVRLVLVQRRILGNFLREPVSTDRSKRQQVLVLSSYVVPVAVSTVVCNLNLSGLGKAFWNVCVCVCVRCSRRAKEEKESKRDEIEIDKRFRSDMDGNKYE